MQGRSAKGAKTWSKAFNFYLLSPAGWPGLRHPQLCHTACGIAWRSTPRSLCQQISARATSALTVLLVTCPEDEGHRLRVVNGRSPEPGFRLCLVPCRGVLAPSSMSWGDILYRSGHPKREDGMHSLLTMPLPAQLISIRLRGWPFPFSAPFPPWHSPVSEGGGLPNHWATGSEGKVRQTACGIQTAGN